MRTLISLVVIVLAPALALADPPVDLYYVGEAKISSPAGKPMGSQVYLLEKTLNRDKATITERALIVREDGKAEEWTLRFAVKENGTFTLTEDSKRAEGTGKLFGPAWKWTYFKGSSAESVGSFSASRGRRLDFLRHGSGVQWVEERKAALAV